MVRCGLRHVACKVPFDSSRRPGTMVKFWEYKNSTRGEGPPACDGVTNGFYCCCKEAVSEGQNGR